MIYPQCGTGIQNLKRIFRRKHETVMRNRVSPCRAYAERFIDIRLRDYTKHGKHLRATPAIFASADMSASSGKSTRLSCSSSVRGYNLHQEVHFQHSRRVPEFPAAHINGSAQLLSLHCTRCCPCGCGSDLRSFLRRERAILIQFLSNVGRGGFAFSPHRSNLAPFCFEKSSNLIVFSLNKR